MFGYITPNMKTLSEAQQKRFRSFYCGLCRTLQQRGGALTRLTLSYDMTFLALVLNALYESEETLHTERCIMHPLHKHDQSS